MDFVVIGLGLSALALLTGLTLLCLVSPRWYRKASPAKPDDSAYARAMAGERRALGQGFLCVGAVLLLATLGGISAGLADKAGAYVIAAMTTVAVLGLAGWDVLYRRRNPAPRRRRVAPVKAPPVAADASASQPTAALPATTTTMVRRRVLPARQGVAPARQPAAAASPETLVDDVHPAGDERPQADVLEPAPDLAETLATASSVVETGPEDDESTAEIAATGNTAPDLTEEPVSEETVDGEPALVVAALPEPVPLEPVKANGAASPDASPASGAESEMVSFGDDRVIALFPTAAARRSRAIIAPTDPDDQS